MKRIPAAEFVRNFSSISDEALAEPVVITRNGRDRLILANIADFTRLLRLAAESKRDDEPTVDAMSCMAPEV